MAAAGAEQQPGTARLRVAARIERDAAPGASRFTLDVDLAFDPGVTCVLGPSGAGKSTILAVVAGLLVPERGRVTLGDEVWLDTMAGTRVPVHKRRVAYLFQHLALFPHMTALANVAYAMPRTVPRAERAEQARILLEHLDVAHLAGRRPRTYSGGEAQRVALARALAVSPRAILLDEPFSALDRELKIPLIARVRDLAAETGVPTVAVTHSIGEARAMADRVVRIAAGRVVADGPPDQVLGGLAPGPGRVHERGLEVTPGPELLEAHRRGR